MASDLGSLVLKLTATTDKLQSDLNKATGQVQAFADRTNSILQAGLSLSMFGQIGNAAQSVVGIFQNIVDQFKALQRESRNLGVTIGELQGLKIWAKGDFDSAASGIMHLEQEIGKAAQGSQEAREKFDKLGLNWRQLRDLSPADAMKLVADIVKDAGSQAEATARAVELLGKSGKDLVGELMKGQEALNAAMEKAQRMEAWNKFTEAVAKKAQGAVQEAQELSGVIDHIFKQIQSGNIADIAKKIGASDWGAIMEDMKKVQTKIESVGKSEPNEMLEWWKQRAKTVEDMKKDFEEIKTPVEKLEEKLRKVAEAVKAGRVGMEQFNEIAEGLADKILPHEKTIKAEFTAPKAIQAGSQEALKFLAESANQDLPQQELQLSKERNEKLEQIKQKLFADNNAWPN